MLPLLQLISREACRVETVSRIRDLEFINCHDALIEAESQGDPFGQVINLLKLAEININKSLEEKRGYYQKALTVAQSGGDTRLSILANVCMARFFFDQADYHGADLYYQNARTIASETKDSDGIRYIDEELLKNQYQLKLEEMVKQSR